MVLSPAGRGLDDVFVAVLAGGRGSRLGGLTRSRCKPAVPFGGGHRIIDFVLSNCTNSGLRRIAILPQYRTYSLLQHLLRAWPQMPRLGLELWPPEQREGGGWYRGTADAIYRNLDVLQAHKPKWVLILAADHVYKMDYGSLLQFHLARRAQVTVGCVEVPACEARHFGVMVASPCGQVERFAEKPENPTALITGDDTVLASMGIYLFDYDVLVRALRHDAAKPESSHDFGCDVIPALVRASEVRVSAHAFRDPRTGGQGYWRDIGTIDSYWQAHMELLRADPPLASGGPDWPIQTVCEPLPPPCLRADSDGGQPTVLIDALVGAGSVLTGALIRESVLAPNVHVGAGSVVERSVLLPGARVGRDCILSNVIVDEGTEILDGTVIGKDPAADRLRFERSPRGVAVVSCAGRERAGVESLHPAHHERNAVAEAGGAELSVEAPGRKLGAL